jgi:hypothetical protein
MSACENKVTQKVIHFNVFTQKMTPGQNQMKKKTTSLFDFQITFSNKIRIASSTLLEICLRM